MMIAGFVHGENWVARFITRPLPVRLGVLALVLAFSSALPVVPAFADDPEPTATTEPAPATTTEPAPATTSEPAPTTTAPPTSEPAPAITESNLPSFPMPQPNPPATPGLPDLRITLAFDKARYLASDQV